MINNGNNNCARSEDLSKEIKMDTASQRGTSNTSNHRDYCHCRHNVCDRLVMTEHMVSYRRYYRQKNQNAWEWVKNRKGFMYNR